MLTYQEEVHPQEDFQEEDSLDGDHQVAEDHPEEECHLFHLPQF
jgi:NAD-dependent dihydropyrimidine dehydrogenase PreA subunit